MRQCSECLEELPPYARFCRECGSEQPLSKELAFPGDPPISNEAEEEAASIDDNEPSEIAGKGTTIIVVMDETEQSEVADKDTDKDTAIITIMDETEQSEVADKDTDIIAVMDETEQSEVADKDTEIITVLSDPSKELVEYLPVPASTPHKESARHLAGPISIPHPELFDEPLETVETNRSAQVEQVEEQTLPVVEAWPVGPPKTGELSASASGKAAEEWRGSWRDLQRVEAGPALDVSRGHALVPEPLASMEDSLLRIRAIRESTQAPEKNLGFWLMLFLLITLIGMLVLLILWTYFPTGF